MTSDREAAGPDGTRGAATTGRGRTSPGCLATTGRRHGGRRRHVPAPSGAGATCSVGRRPTCSARPTSTSSTPTTGTSWPRPARRCGRRRADGLPPARHAGAGRDRRYWWTRWSVTWPTTASRATGVDYLAPHPTKGPPSGRGRGTPTPTPCRGRPTARHVRLRRRPPGAYDDFLAAVVDDDRATVDRAVRRTLDDGGPYVVDFRVADRRAAEHWFHAAGRLLERPAGAPRHLGGRSSTSTRSRATACRAVYRLRLMPARASTAAGTPTSRHDW